MSWDRSRANARIQTLIQSIPTADVSVERFADQYFPRRLQERTIAKSKGEAAGSPILTLPYRKAILVEGVHVYANLINYDDFMVDHDDETEASHRNALQFLHLHYSTCDALVREFDLQRVDYHGSRLHAVVVTPAGSENAGERARRAVAFAVALDRLVQDANAQIAGGRFGSPLRVGVDSGPSVAINSGRGIESEPLFLGDPANYAAKLAAGDSPGLYLSDRVRQDLDELPVGGLKIERTTAIDSLNSDRWYQQAQVDDAVGRANSQIMGDTGLREFVAPNGVFRFHYHKPPLRTIRFQELMPSRSIRMPMIAVFADLDGFTDYVSEAIANGNEAEMVARLHVMRGEMTNVLRDDFSGKKIRFVGDGLQGVVAEGDSLTVDETASIDRAVRCAAAIRSSFVMCDQALGASSLGLGIGVELGTMPVTRLDMRGTSSVRCATGRAATIAEEEQQRCDGSETAIGTTAYARSSVRVKAMFGATRIMPNLLYEDSNEFLSKTPAAPVAITESRTQRSSPPLRAHSHL